MFVMFNGLYRCPEAARAIEDPDATAAYQFTEWPPRNTVVASQQESAMRYTKLGRTGLDVSRLCLGCMSYGGGNSGFHQWSLGEEESRPFIRKALEAGINFFDTANRDSVGKSEEVLGRAIRDFARREDVVIATKVYNRMRPGPNGAGLSRKAILFEIDESLRRLGTDYVDLYQIHRFDPETPIEETMDALCTMS